MEMRRFGRTDMVVSVIGLGCWSMAGPQAWEGTSDEQSIYLIDKAIDIGVNFIDTAPLYGRGHSESVVGRAIKRKRDKVYIATKCGVYWAEGDNYQHRNCSKRRVVAELEESLGRLGVDYVDLYQMHWPDLQRPAEDLMETFNYLKSTGKVRHIGVCSCPLSLLDEMRQYGEIASSQNLYNMIDRNAEQFFGMHLAHRTEDEIWPYCVEHGIAGIPFQPLCQGLLTGAIDTNTKFAPTDVRSKNGNLKGERLIENLKKVEQVKAVADRLGKPLAQVAINWVYRNPAVTTIIAGSTSVEFLLDNIEAVSWKIDDATYAELNAILDDTKE